MWQRYWALKALAAGTNLLGWTPAAHAGALQDGLQAANAARQRVGLPAGRLSLYLASIILFLLSFVAILTLGALIIGGIMYITSLGDETKVQKAKNIILYGIIGAIITAVSFVIVAVIGALLAP